jgi:hypothetical protein
MAKRRAIRDVVLDAWSAISYKAPLKDAERANARGLFATSWLSPKAARRLNAYTVLSAYEANSARHFVDREQSQDEADENREYGDAALIVDQVLAALLGETQEIVVVGAEDYQPGLEDELTEAAAAADAELGDDEEPTGLSDDDLERIEENRAAGLLAERQDFLRAWADRIHLELRMVDCERNSVHLGDGVYLLGWDKRRSRVTAAVMDPGSYFPVLPDTIDTYEYPERVHFAWELDGEDFDDHKPRLRRITYDVAPIRWEAVTNERGEVVDVKAPPGTTVVSGGEDMPSHIEKTYPWSDEPSRYACYMTDATWVLDEANKANDIDALTYATAVFATDEDGVEIRDYDCGFDFVPVIHMPNTPPGGHHFGQSSLSRILQLLDDIQGADTDAQRASSTAGSPVTIIHGAQAPNEKSNPRDVRAYDAEGSGSVQDDGHYTLQSGDTVFIPGAGGATVLDTSNQLAELRNLVASLLDRMSVNSRLPASVLGRMKPSEAPSGYAIALSFGPLTAMIRQMRLTRSVKYPLMLKMVQRIYQVNDELDPGETPRAEIRLGSYLPSDMAGTLALVKDSVEAGLISLETGIDMLVGVGFPVDDISEEIKRIQSRDYEGANALADATGDANAVRVFLGLEALPENEVVPTPAPAPPAPVPPTPTA